MTSILLISTFLCNSTYWSHIRQCSIGLEIFLVLLILCFKKTNILHWILQVSINPSNLSFSWLRSHHLTCPGTCHNSILSWYQLSLKSFLLRSLQIHIKLLLGCSASVRCSQFYFEIIKVLRIAILISFIILVLKVFSIQDNLNLWNFRQEKMNFF